MGGGSAGGGLAPSRKDRFLRWLGRLFDGLSRDEMIRRGFGEGITVDPGEPGENPFVAYQRQRASCPESHAHCSPHDANDYCFTTGCGHAGGVTMEFPSSLPAHTVRLRIFGRVRDIRIKDLPDPLTAESMAAFIYPITKGETEGGRRKKEV